MKQAVMCIATDEVQARNIVDALRMSGFTDSDMSVLMADKTGVRDSGYEKHSKAPEGTATGAAAGAIAGGALGWMAGIGALAIPGAGPFIAAGPIMAALAGSAIGGSAGGVTGGLIGLGMPEFEAKQYEGKLNAGNILISVHTEDGEQAKRAEQVMKGNGAKDIARSGEESVKGKQ
ncbi:MAG: DUF3341 domain-containing protein [Cyanobacteria bacterium TGS_CYA1]|nr:DUF3341 domain-containing protein [Cyanobacteria bacterium TGS_CYA1]